MDTGKEMTLKKTNQGEYELLYRIFSNGDIVRYTNFKKYDDLSTFNTFMDKFLKIGLNEPLQHGPYSIYLNNSIIGLCGAQQRYPETGSSELWYILHKDYWGKGLAKQAVELLIKECKSNIKLKSLYAEAVDSNPASWKILEKTGFVKTGELKGGFKKGDVVEDLRLYMLEL